MLDLVYCQSQSVFEKGFLQDVRHNLREYFFKHGLKHPLHQQHIQNRSTANTKQCILFPLMQKYDKQNRNGFWQPIRSACGHFLQAIHDQKADYRIWKHLPKMKDKCRRLFAFLENKEWQKTGDRGSQNHAGNDDNTLSCCLCFSS